MTITRKRLEVLRRGLKDPMTANNLWFTQSIQDLLDTVESLLDRQEKLEAVAQCATYHIHEEEDDGACSICDSLDALRETKEKL